MTVYITLFRPCETQTDTQALIQGLREGVIDAICSSHQPHEAAAKNLPFEAAEPGISALETFLPLVGKLEQQGFSKIEVLKLIRSKPCSGAWHRATELCRRRTC